MKVGFEERSTFVNRLKLFCILGIFTMHVALTFTFVPNLYPFWIFDVSSPSLVLTGMSSLLNSVCMPLFFYLAGTMAHRHVATRNAERFFQRSKKWSIYLCITWPIVAASIVFATWWSGLDVSWQDVVFPRQPDQNTMFFWLPINFFHLWFLVCLMLYEFLVGLFLRRGIRISIPFKWALPLVLLVHACASFFTHEGFLMTPFVFNDQTLFSFIAYLAWYIFGLGYPIDKMKSFFGSGLQKAIPVLFVVTLYFISKYVFLNHHDNLSNFWWVVLVSCDALIVIALFVLWRIIDDENRVFSNFPLIKEKGWQQWVLNHQLGIYIVQIPVIFLVFSFAKSFTIIDVSVKSANLTPPSRTECLETWFTYLLFIVVIVCICYVLLQFFSWILKTRTQLS